MVLAEDAGHVGPREGRGGVDANEGSSVSKQYAVARGIASEGRMGLINYYSLKRAANRVKDPKNMDDLRDMQRLKLAEEKDGGNFAFTMESGAPNDKGPAL